jgi:gliding motility-associated protein GldL
MAQEKQFNYLNLAYGIGAAIILIAAMFKFLGLKYANTIFVAGIFIEAIIFLISAFDWSVEKKDYEWEKVFPQLDEDGNPNVPMSSGMIEGTQQQQIEQIMNTIISLNHSVNELNSATRKLTHTVENMDKNYETISQSTQRYCRLPLFSTFY